MKYADAEAYEIEQQIISIEYQLARHNEALQHYRESGDRMKAVMAKLNVIECEHMLASLRRKLG